MQRHFPITDYKMSIAKRFQSLIYMINLYDICLLMMYVLFDLVIDSFCLVSIGVVKTHLCSRHISYFPYDR